MGIFYFLANFNEYQSYETHYVTMRVMTIHINIIIIPRLMSKRLNGAFQMRGENEPFQGTKSQDRPHPQNQQRKCGVTIFKALSVLSVGSESFFPLLLYLHRLLVLHSLPDKIPPSSCPNYIQFITSSTLEHPSIKIGTLTSQIP